MAVEKQLVVAVEGTAALGPFWQTIVSEYLEKIIRSFYGSEVTGQKLSDANPEFALVLFNAHGPYSACLVARSGWIKDVDTFLQWLSALPFSGGGFSEAAVADGISEALLMLSAASIGNQSQQNIDCQKHCILVAASNPHPLPTPVPRPPTENLDKNDNAEVQPETFLADAETVAKSFAQSHASLSVISPKQLPKLRAIYTAGKRNPRANDPTVDHNKNPQFLILLSENFLEARAALSRPGVAALQPNQGVIKVDGPPLISNSGPPPVSINAGNGPMMNRQPISVGTIPPATVKVEPTTLSSIASGAAFSHVPSISTVSSQGNQGLPTSSPNPASQETTVNAEVVQDFKPLVNPVSQTLRPVGPAAANVSILNNLSQARQAMNSASISGANSIGLPTMGVTPMAMHMSNMISNGMASSGLSGMTSISGSGALMATAPVGQNTALGSFTSASSNISGNSNLGTSLPNIQDAVGMGQSLPGMSQPSLTSGSQMGQSGLGMNQNAMNGLAAPSISTGAGTTMIPTPGISQQPQTGLHPLGATNGSTMSIPSQQHAPGSQQSQSRYVKIWEGALSGQRQGQPVFICKLEGYRSATSSEKLAEDWPPAMQIVRLISQDHMNNKQYAGKADFLVFRTLNQHGFLGQLQEKKLCAVIQLPSQTLLLSVSEKPSRLIGMLFPGDMVVFKPQISSQQQQLQQQQQQQQQLQQQQQQQQQKQLQQQQLQQQQLQQQLHQQPQQQLQSQLLHQQPQQQQLQPQQQQLQQQQLHQQTQQHQPQMQRPQMVGTGMNQTFAQGPGRSQMMPQGMMPQQGQGNMPGGGSFIP